MFRTPSVINTTYNAKQTYNPSLTPLTCSAMPAQSFPPVTASKRLAIDLYTEPNCRSRPSTTSILKSPSLVSMFSICEESPDMKNTPKAYMMRTRIKIAQINGAQQLIIPNTIKFKLSNSWSFRITLSKRTRRKIRNIRNTERLTAASAAISKSEIKIREVSKKFQYLPGPTTNIFFCATIRMNNSRTKKHVKKSSPAGCVDSWLSSCNLLTWFCMLVCVSTPMNTVFAKIPLDEITEKIGPATKA